MVNSTSKSYNKLVFLSYFNNTFKGLFNIFNLLIDNTILFKFLYNIFYKLYDKVRGWDLLPRIGRGYSAHSI